MAASISVRVGDIEVAITHPDKVFFPTRGETKLDLVRYYEAVAEPLMATLGGRPVLLALNGDGWPAFLRGETNPDWGGFIRGNWSESDLKTASTSRVLNLAAFLAHEEIVAPHGVIYGIPHRHLLLLHVVGEGDSVRAVTELAGAAMTMSQDAPGGQLSDSAYYWHEGASERISVPADGSLHIYPSERLVEALNVTTGS